MPFLTLDSIPQARHRRFGARPHATGSAPGSPGRLLVLYVEDQPVNALLMQALFERVPEAELITAEYGWQALDLMADRTPALLLLDIGLPDCRGTELLPRLRALPTCAHAPAVAVTAEHALELEGTGFCELWHKPLDLPRVLERLHQLLAPAARVPALRA